MSKVIQPAEQPSQPKLLKRIIRLLGIVIGVLALLIVVLFVVGNRRINNAPAIVGNPIPIPIDAEALERGEKLAAVSSCNECHGANFEGTVFVDESPIGYVPASNLTMGEGGIGGDYSAESWELAIRHGVAADGRVITAMPSNHYAEYGDDDLGALIAYMQQIPPQDNDLGDRRLTFPGNIIFGVLAYGGWAVNLTDHDAVGGNVPMAASSAEYGEYLINISSCNSCHAENLAGNYGQLESPLGPNLTVWPSDQSYDAFSTALRSGVGSDGELLDSELMPWPNYARFTETEIEALWAYLSSLEQLPNNK